MSGAAFGLVVSFAVLAVALTAYRLGFEAGSTDRTEKPH